jgi:CRP-like cAMP-binding protein
MLGFSDTALMSLLSGAIVEEMTSAGHLRQFEKGQLIHSRGGGRPGLSIILSGRVRFGIYHENGGYTQASILGTGHCFGEATLFMGAPRAYDAESFGATRLLELPPQSMTNLMQRHPELSEALLRTLTHRLYAALDMADDLRGASKEERIEKHLRRLIQMGGFETNTLPIRQTDLAFALGLSRVSIGKALDSLQKNGLIRLGYGEIELL